MLTEVWLKNQRKRIKDGFTKLESNIKKGSK